jgi:hypothetical protein
LVGWVAAAAAAAAAAAQALGLGLEHRDHLLDLLLVLGVLVLAEVAGVVVDRLVVGLGLRRLLALHVVGSADVVEELRHRPRLVGLLERGRRVVELARQVIGLALVERALRVLPRVALGGGAPGGPQRQHQRDQQKDT